MQDPNVLPLMGISLACTSHEEYAGVILEISSESKSLSRLRKIVETSVEKIPLIFSDRPVTVDLKSVYPMPMLALTGDEEPSPLMVKAVLVGETNVGKTQLYERYLKGGNYKPTYKKSNDVRTDSKKLNFDQKEFNLQIWDTPGADRFSDMRRIYLRDTDAFILCVDLHKDPDLVFSDVKKWLSVIHDNSEYSEPVVLLVDAKCDDTFTNRTSREQMERLAASLEIPYLECSAHKDINVSVLFETLAKMVFLKQLPQYKFSLYIKGARVEQLSSTDFYHQLNQHLQEECVELSSSTVTPDYPHPDSDKDRQLRVLDEFIEKTKSESKGFGLRK